MMVWSSIQWPFQEPKLEVTTIYKAYTWIFLGDRAKAKQTKPWYYYKPSHLGMHMHGCLEHPFKGHFDGTCCQNMLRLGTVQPMLRLAT